MDKKQEFEALAEDALFGISNSDSEQRFLYLNPKFTQLFGYTLAELPDKPTWFERAYADPLYREKVIVAWAEDMLKEYAGGEAEPRIFTERVHAGRGHHVRTKRQCRI